MKIFKSNKHIYFALSYKDVSIAMCNQVINTKEIDYIISIITDHFNGRIIDAKSMMERWFVWYMAQEGEGLMIFEFTDYHPSAAMFHNNMSISIEDFEDECEEVCLDDINPINTIKKWEA